eukprot:349738-Chlamydomonas_euryale.AAC.12
MALRSHTHTHTHTHTHVHRCGVAQVWRNHLPILEALLAAGARPDIPDGESGCEGQGRQAKGRGRRMRLAGEWFVWKGQRLLRRSAVSYTHLRAHETLMNL